MEESKKKIVSLYDRLPAIYKERDEKQQPQYQLKQYLEIFETIFNEIHENIESLYHDIFIETCADWAIPYIGDLLGVSYLKGDSWTRRADVADTIKLRRRKGTLGAIGLLVYDLTKWGVYCVELRDRMLLNQNINYYNDYLIQKAILSESSQAINQSPVNGTVNIRDPALLSLLHTPFDPFAHTADLQPLEFNNIRYNIPNLAIFLWRLKDYQIRVSKPVVKEGYNVVIPDVDLDQNEANFIVKFHVHPLGRPLILFNKGKAYVTETPLRSSHLDETPGPIVPGHLVEKPLRLSHLDETPGPIVPGRLTEGTPAGNPTKYVSVTYYDLGPFEDIQFTETGLQLHLKNTTTGTWSFRGEDLSYWEKCLGEPLKVNEIAIDPVLGRIMFGVDSDNKAEALAENLYLTFTYGAMEGVGAHPISRKIHDKWNKDSVVKIAVPPGDEQQLKTVLENQQSKPVIIEIQDSSIYELDLEEITLYGPRYIIAKVDQPDDQPNSQSNNKKPDEPRPIIKLKKPLRFRPRDQGDLSEEDDLEYQTFIKNLVVRLEGLFITRSDDYDGPLFTRTALNKLEIKQCTLDPIKFSEGEDNGVEILPSMNLDGSYGFTDGQFNEIPQIHLKNSICGPLHIDSNYSLILTNSIIDAGKGVREDPEDKFAVTGYGAVDETWGPPTKVYGVTFFGQVRVEEISGQGAIFVHPLAVQNTLKGCLRYSYLSGNKLEMPQREACVFKNEANPPLRFVSEAFGEPAYGRLAHNICYKIRERGPDDNAMGAFGFLKEADKWQNIFTRFREFMPVGVNPNFFTVT